MKPYRIIYTVAVLFFAAFCANAQVDRHDVRSGNRRFSKEKYREAEIDYRKALLKDTVSMAANYNLASTLYREENFEEAAKVLERIKEVAPLSERVSDYNYNAGDIALARKDYAAAVESFKQSLLAKIVVTFEDGTSQTIVTDQTWKKYDNGPVTRNGFQFGEDYDARKEVDGWKDGGFDDSKWAAAEVFEAPGPAVQIQAYVGLPIQNNITLEAVSVTEPVKGTFVYDFGQNVVGVPRLEGMKGKSGQVVNLRYGEMIYPETIPTKPVAPYTVEMYKAKKGQVYVENYRGAISIDNYIMRGKKEGETYQPIFTDHGFRYVSVTGLDKPLPKEAVKAVVLESIGKTTSLYETDNANINRLFQNVQ